MRLSEVLDRLIELAEERDRVRGRRSRPKTRTRPLKLVAIPLSQIQPAPPPPQNESMRTLLAPLPPAAISLLLVVMYVGRGDFDTDDLLDHYVQMSDTLRRPEWSIQAMIDKSPLADYLKAGRGKIRAAGIDLDRLFGT